MNPIYRPKSPTLIDKFILNSNKLARDKNNQNIDCAVNSWCSELCIDRYFPQASRAIINHKNQWIQDNRVFDNVLQLYSILLVITDRRATKGLGNLVSNFNNISGSDFYYNIKEAKEKMSAKSIVLIAFVLTGIGLLLFLLNKKEPKNQSQYSERLYQDFNSQLVKEKYVLALLIKSDRYQELIHSLDNNKILRSQDSSKLYGATQGLWIGAKSKFNKSRIKQELINPNPITTTSEYDVHFITIELEKDDSRFNPDVNPMDRRDAFVELGNKSVQVTVSPRLSCKAYENTEFYSR